MVKKLFKLHLTISADPEATPMVAVVAHDEHGFIIGERDAAMALRDVLDRYLRAGKYDGAIDEFDERLGWTHIDITTAVQLASVVSMPVSAPVIRAACAGGRIRGAHLDGKTWRFPQARFLGWLKSAPRKRGRPGKASG